MNKEQHKELLINQLKHVLINRHYGLVDTINNMIKNNGSDKDQLVQLIMKAEDQIQKLRNTITKAERISSLRNDTNLADDCIYEANKVIARMKKNYL